MDTVKTLALNRHFYTADVRLADYGQVLLVGDLGAVERVIAIIREHDEHDLISVDLETPRGEAL